jgi:hypothetical protein
MTLKRYINCFYKKKDDFAKEINFDEVPIQSLLKAAGISSENIEADPLLYYVYPIDSKNIKPLEELLKIKIPIDQYDCFLECAEID